MNLNTQEIIHWRRHLHQHPELAFQEVKTSQFVVQKLKEFGVDSLEVGLGLTGVVATIHGSGFSKGSPGKMIGLRADMDALPLQEKNAFAHVSQSPGIMHACGHDGHTAMLLGAAKYLCDNRRFQGTVFLIFQPAEEGKGGAKKMMEDGLFKFFPMEAVFGLHNWPSLPQGHVGATPGPVMAASDFVDIVVTGRGGHAALPHLTIDPVVVASQLVLALQSLVSRQADPLSPCVLSITQINGGTTFNIIPEEVTLKGSCRAMTEEMRIFLESKIKTISRGIGESYGAKIEATYRRGYPPTINTPKEAQLVAEVAAQLIGEDRVHRNLEPSMGAEDFSFMLEEKPGCYFWLGAGNPSQGDCRIHNPNYDFNDGIVDLGVKLWVKICETYLSR